MYSRGLGERGAYLTNADAVGREFGRIERNVDLLRGRTRQIDGRDTGEAGELGDGDAAELCCQVPKRFVGIRRVLKYRDGTG